MADVLDTRKLDQVLRDLEPDASKIVNKYGTAITGEAAKGAPVDTGALRASLLSESKLREKLLFILQDGVEYGLRQELGFVGVDSLGRSYNQAARPFVVPAILRWERRFLDAFKELFK